MEEISRLSIPNESKWINKINNHDGCSTACDHCNKKMYPTRQKYLQSWLKIYIANEQRIIDGLRSQCKIDALIWMSTHNAPSLKIGVFHKLYCNTGTLTSECKCNIAWLLRSLYNNINEDDVVYNIEMIYNAYKNLKEKTKPKICDICNIYFQSNSLFKRHICKNKP